MARHHPDLVMCRKQPGIGMWMHKLLCAPVPQTHLFPSNTYTAIGRLCERCMLCMQAPMLCMRHPSHPHILTGDGKCVICDSHVRPATLVRVCDECNYGSYQGRCVICGGVGVSDAYYCKECTQLEKDVCRTANRVCVPQVASIPFYKLTITHRGMGVRK